MYLKIDILKTICFYNNTNHWIAELSQKQNGAFWKTRNTDNSKNQPIVMLHNQYIDLIIVKWIGISCYIDFSQTPVSYQICNLQIKEIVRLHLYLVHSYTQYS